MALVLNWLNLRNSWLKLEKELREWNFDDQLPVLARTGTEDPIESRLYGMCASSTTGKLFIYGGLIDEDNQILSTKIDYFYNFQIEILQTLVL